MMFLHQCLCRIFIAIIDSKVEKVVQNDHEEQCGYKIYRYHSQRFINNKKSSKRDLGLIKYFPVLEIKIELSCQTRKNNIIKYTILHLKIKRRGNKWKQQKFLMLYAYH